MKKVKITAVLLILIFLSAGYAAAGDIGHKGIASDVRNITADYILDPGDDISSVISEAPDGSTIVLKQGVYEVQGSISMIGKSDITISGEGDVRIDTKGTTHPVFYLEQCDNIVFQGIKAQHVKNGDEKVIDAKQGSVILVSGGGRLYFNRCELVGCGIYGIFAEGTGYIGIDKCYLHHNSLNALCFVNNTGTTEVRIRDSMIINNRGFIEKEGNIDIFLEGNNTVGSNDEEGYNAGTR